MVSRLHIVGLVAAVVLSLGIGTQARAGGKVDWSEYLEPAGSHPPKHADVFPQQAAKDAPAAKEEEPAAKPAKKGSAKAAKKKGAESRAKAKRQPARGKRHR